MESRLENTDVTNLNLFPADASMNRSSRGPCSCSCILRHELFKYFSLAYNKVYIPTRNTKVSLGFLQNSYKNSRHSNKHYAFSLQRQVTLGPRPIWKKNIPILRWLLASQALRAANQSTICSSVPITHVHPPRPKEREPARDLDPDPDPTQRARAPFTPHADSSAPAQPTRFPSGRARHRKRLGPRVSQHPPPSTSARDGRRGNPDQKRGRESSASARAGGKRRERASGYGHTGPDRPMLRSLFHPPHARAPQS